MNKMVPFKLCRIEGDRLFSVTPKEWTNTINKVIHDNRNYFSEEMKHNTEAVSKMLDIEPAMKKRRIDAMLASLKKLNEKEQKYAYEWIFLNFQVNNYTILEYEGYILTAAAIWILDRLTEHNVSLDKVFALLPKDEKLIDNILKVDIHDCRYDTDLIASVEYVLHYRNKDIAPMEINYDDKERLITSNLAAKGKDHADVPSRQAFEKLLDLIPQQVKEDAVRRFEECYKVWKKRSFVWIEYLVGKNREKVKALKASGNEIHMAIKEQNKYVEQIYAKEKRLMKKKKISSNKKHENAFLIDPIKINAEEKYSVLANGHEQVNIDSLHCFDMEKINKMAEQYNSMLEEAMSEYDKCLELVPYIIQYGSNLKDAKELFKDDKLDEVLKPFPVTDPYEMCFALLYLTEQGSDIPWLYGSCQGMMSEVACSLPWGVGNYNEYDTAYWKEKLPADSDTPDFPNFYKREYCKKEGDESSIRNLAQIIYEITGCLMPRDIHRYDAELKNLENYGINQNDAILLLHCMLALGNSRHRIKAENLEPDYMDRLLPEDKDEVSKEELIVRKTELERQVQQLRSALYTSEKAVEETKKELAEQKAATEAEQRELADLREIIFNKEEFDNYDSSTEKNIDNSKYPYTVRKRTVVFGGHEKWLKAFKPMMKGDIRFIPKDMKIDASLIKYADVIWVQTNVILHRFYYSIINAVRKYNKPIRYFTSVSAVKCAEQLIENDRI